MDSKTHHAMGTGTASQEDVKAPALIVQLRKKPIDRACIHDVCPCIFSSVPLIC